MGAKGNNAFDDSARLQQVFSRGLCGYTLPAGQYVFATGLVNDYRVAFALPGTPSPRADLRGDSMANTILKYSGTGYAMSLYGSDDSGAGQGIHSMDAYRNFTLQDSASARANSGLYLQNKAFWRLSDLYFQYLDTALELQSCFTGALENCYFTYSNHGVKLTANALGACNAIKFDRVTFSSNVKAGVLGGAVGSALSFRDCTIEGNGTQGDATTGGLILNLGAYGYAGPLTLDSCYFEVNKGNADLQIDNTTGQHLAVLVRGCLFNRASGAAFTTYNIVATSSGGGRITVVLQGNSFVSTGSYAPSAARPFVHTNAPALVEFIDGGGNAFTETTSLVAPFASGRTLAGRVGTGGALVDGPASITSARLSAGVYRVTRSAGFGKGIGFYVAAATSQDPFGAARVHSVVQQSATAFDVSMADAASVLTDGAFSFSVQCLGGA